MIINSNNSLRQIFVFVFIQWFERPWHITLTVLLALFSALSDILMPVFSANFINVLTTESSLAGSFFMVVTLGIAGVLMRQWLNLSIARLTLEMMSETGSRAFKQVQIFTTDWHSSGFSGSTVRQITRGMWALVSFNETLLAGLLPIGLILVGSTITVWLRWPGAGLIFGSGVILFSMVTIVLTVAYVAPVARQGNFWDSRLGGLMADALTCNSVVKAFGAESREEAQLAKTLKQWQKHTWWAWKRSNINGGAQDFMLVAFQIMIFGLLFWLWHHGRINIGDITFMLTTFFMLQGYLRKIGSSIRHLQSSVNELEAIVSFKHHPTELVPQNEGRQVSIKRGEIRFEQVDFSYHRSAVQLFYNRLSIIIRPGEKVGLVGYSGSGKSTFVRLIQRLYEIQGGNIIIDGQDIATLPLAALRSKIAIVPQESLLFHRTIAENISYSKPGAARIEIETAAKLAAIHDLILSLPDGYDTLVGERGIKLSGGERQRVAIARAFLLDAPLLILDEATSSLDSESESQIQRALEKLMENRTTLVIAHRLSTLCRMDKILAFENGKIVEEGSHEDLMQKSSGLYRRLFNRQQQV